MPGLKERMQSEGYSEQEMVDLLNQRLSSEDASSAGGRRRFRPSQHPLGFGIVVVLATALGYFGQFDTGHNSKTKFHGLVGALIAATVMGGVLVVMEVAARRRQ